MKVNSCWTTGIRLPSHEGCIFYDITCNLLCLCHQRILSPFSGIKWLRFKLISYISPMLIENACFFSTLPICLLEAFGTGGRWLMNSVPNVLRTYMCVCVCVCVWLCFLAVVSQCSCFHCEPQVKAPRFFGLFWFFYT